MQHYLISCSALRRLIGFLKRSERTSAKHVEGCDCTQKWTPAGNNGRMDRLKLRAKLVALQQKKRTR